MAPRNLVLHGRVEKKLKRRASLSSQFAALTVTAQNQIAISSATNDQTSTNFEVRSNFGTVYDIKAAVLNSRGGAHKIMHIDSHGRAYCVPGNSMEPDQLIPIIAELESQIRDLGTRIRYHKTRFLMITRSQHRFRKMRDCAAAGDDILLLQKELQDGEELLASLREEAAHGKMFELRDQKFDKNRPRGVVKRSVSM